MNKNRITRSAFAIVILCFLLSTFVSLWSLRHLARQNLQELSKSLAARINDTIASELSETIIVARAMANDSFLIRALEDEDTRTLEQNVDLMSEFLSGLQDELGYEATFVVSDASRRYYAPSGLNKIVDTEADAHDRWYADFIEEDVPYALSVDRDELSSGAWTVFVNATIDSRQGKLLGVCGVGVRMSGSEDLLNELEREYNVKINLIDADRMVKVDTNEANIDNIRLDDVNIERSDNYVYQRQNGNQLVVTRYIEKLDWYLVVQSDESSRAKQFLNVIVLNIVLCLLVMVILLLAIRFIAERTRTLTNASFRDQTTMLLNRRAFEEEKARLLETGLGEDFVYVTADVNGLKTANDTLGHAAGDELIIGAAECMRRHFGLYGKVFRIGGDEFAAMLDIPEEAFGKVVAAFEAAVAAWSGDRVKELSVSCGYAKSREFPSENLAELSRISDERMYAAKEAHYRSTGKARRG